MKNDKISIIIPIYNCEKFLNKCLDSVINQTYKNLEIICVNDGSKDNSLEIIKEYQKKDERIVIIDKQNEGVSAARNDAIKKSTGEYITFIDSDDWIELNTIEILYNTLIENDVDVIRGNYYLNTDYDKCTVVENLLELKNKKICKDNFSEELIDKLLVGTIQSYIWLLLIKRDCILRCNLLFKEDISLMEDAIFYVELFNNINSIYFLDKPLYHYYFNVNSCTKSDKFYVRNINNLVKVDDYLIKIIQSSKFKSSSRTMIINNRIASIILDNFYSLYRSFNGNKKDLKKIMNDILDNQGIYNLLCISNLNNVKNYIKITRNLLLKRKYKILFIIYEARKTISKLKRR